MKLHNTLSKKTETFQPQNPGQVTIYSCGPTVYDHVHIGNLSSFIAADTLRRSLQLSGNNVKHVMNITDIDDKTVARSRERYADLNPEEALRKLTQKYEKVFMNDMKAIGNDISSLSFVKATGSIEEMKELIRVLLKQKFAYIADDGIYFSISAYTASGKKYGQLTDITASSTAQARIDNDEYDKESAHDFALWKKQKTGEPAWDFEIDGQNIKGRPGWHIECSAMSAKELGQPFDIHTGGIDLKFPHHENEIAQSTAAKEDSVYARFFIHNEHILVDGKKMAKSAGNFYTLQELIDKGFDPLAFRLLVLQSHYRNQAAFSWKNLEAAQSRLQTFRQAADMAWQPQSEKNTAYDQSEIKKALENDLATPQALSLANGILDEVIENGVSKNKVSDFIEFLSFLDKAFGLNLASTKDISPEQKNLIASREEARKNKDWPKSDELRDKLKEQGISLNDTERGAVWWRIYKS